MLARFIRETTAMEVSAVPRAPEGGHLRVGRVTYVALGE